MPFRRSSSSYKPSYKSYSSKPSFKPWSISKSYETKKGFSFWSSKPKTVINKTTIISPGYGPAYHYTPHYVPVAVGVGVATPVYHDSDFGVFDFLGVCLFVAVLAGVLIWFLNRNA
jgi:hypothetical protein